MVILEFKRLVLVIRKRSEKFNRICFIFLDDEVGSLERLGEVIVIV